MRLRLIRNPIPGCVRLHVVAAAGRLVADCSPSTVALRSVVALVDAHGAPLGGAQEFTLRQRIFSWGRCFDVVASAYDGVCVRGSIGAANFAIARGEQVIASVDPTAFGLAGETVVELHTDTAELFACAVICVLAASQAGGTAGAGDEDDDVDDDDDDDWRRRRGRGRLNRTGGLGYGYSRWD